MKVGTGTDTDTDLPARLRLDVMRLSRVLRQQNAGNISASMLSALSTIDKEGSVTLGALAAHERVAPPSMTRIVARLEEQGLVIRAVDASDRRVARVSVSAPGRTFLPKNRARKDAYLAARLR